MANIAEAIRGYVASLRKHAEAVPEITEIAELEVAV